MTTCSVSLVAESYDLDASLNGVAWPVLTSLDDGTHDLVNLADNNDLTALGCEIPKLHRRRAFARLLDGRRCGCGLGSRLKPGDHVLASHLYRERIGIIVLVHDDHVTHHIRTMSRLAVYQLPAPLERCGAARPGRFTLARPCLL